MSGERGWGSESDCRLLDCRGRINSKSKRKPRGDAIMRCNTKVSHGCYCMVDLFSSDALLISTGLLINLASFCQPALYRLRSLYFLFASVG